MDRQQLLDLFRRMATEVVEKDFSDVGHDANVAELGIDSLGMLELVGALERELDVAIPDEELGGIQTVDQLLDVVGSRTAGRP